MSILDLIFSKEKKVPFPSVYFETCRIGGIKVDVNGLLNSDCVRWEGYARNSYLKKHVINEKSDLRISDYVVMIFNFGIVNNSSLIENNGEINKVITFQFKDAKKYMIDTTGDDHRINQIEKNNSYKFDGII